jgi:hypothetical protein
LKELERENAQLKRIVADQALQCQALKKPLVRKLVAESLRHWFPEMMAPA